MLNFLLTEDTKYRLSVGRIIDILAGKKIIHQPLHLFITQYLSLRYCSLASQTQSQSLIDFING